MAKIRALRGVIAPVTSGRLRVRCITLSMSRSTNMLMALAPPAANAPPSRVAAINQTGGRPRWATIMVGRVVIEQQLDDARLGEGHVGTDLRADGNLAGESDVG